MPHFFRLLFVLRVFLAPAFGQVDKPEPKLGDPDPVKERMITMIETLEQGKQSVFQVIKQQAHLTQRLTGETPPRSILLGNLQVQVELAKGLVIVVRERYANQKSTVWEWLAAETFHLAQSARWMRGLRETNEEIVRIMKAEIASGTVPFISLESVRSWKGNGSGTLDGRKCLVGFFEYFDPHYTTKFKKS
jgi:hypothetical protein